MEPLGIGKIIDITRGRLLQGNVDNTVCAVYTDSRTQPQSGSLFVPLVGENFDGHDFIDQVGAKPGVVGVLCERKNVECANTDAALIKVDDTLVALQRIAAYNRSLQNIPVIGITGSAGKTTTKEVLGAIACLAGTAVVSKASFNNHIGVPLTLLEIDSNTEFAVVEMGMNAFGEIANLSALAKPDVAVITNAGPCHLEALGSVEGVARAKCEIIGSLDSQGVLVVNGDDKVLCRTAIPLAEKKGIRVVTFGVGAENDFQALRIDLSGQGLRFSVQSSMLEGPVDVSSGLEGTYNVLNCLAAFSAAWMSGFGLDEICQGISQAKSAKMRWEEKTLDGSTFILDCYNANPLAVKCGLETLAQKYAASRKVFVFGNMYELGDECHDLHRKVGAQMVKNGIDVAVLVGEFAAFAATELEHLGYGPHNIIKCEDNAEAARKLSGVIADGDVVYFKGSRMSKMEEIFELYCKGIESKKVGKQ